MKKIKKALISVSDKKNLIFLIRALKKHKIQIISSGGTYKEIKKLGYNCLEISKYTNSKEILDGLLKRYIETQIFQAVIENNACEQAAKMIAMKNASENAEEIIKGLQLVYNNARQASITQELSEIVGGAAAI